MVKINIKVLTFIALNDKMYLKSLFLPRLLGDLRIGEHNEKISQVIYFSISVSFVLLCVCFLLGRAHYAQTGGYSN